MSAFDEDGCTLRCSSCGVAMVEPPPRRPARALREWFFDGQRLYGHHEYRCPGCGHGATAGSVAYPSVGRLPAALAIGRRLLPFRLVARLDAERRVEYTPAFFAGVAAVGVISGAAAVGPRASRWSAAVGAVTAVTAARTAQLASALEPGARWLTLVETWHDTRDRESLVALNRSTVRRLKGTPFPLIGVVGWDGPVSVVGYGYDDRFVVTSAMLQHGDAMRGPRVLVETNRDPSVTRAEHAADDERRILGEVALQIDGRRVVLHRCSPSHHDHHEWEAVGAVDGLGLAVRAAGISPSQLRFTVGVNPDPYISGT